MNYLIEVFNWITTDNHVGVVAWIVAAIAGAALKTYRQHHADDNAAADLDFIQRTAKDYAHAVNRNPNIPTTEIKSAIISGVQSAVASYNENHKTRTINVTNSEISNAADIAIDYFQKEFGGFSEAKATNIADEAIKAALSADTAPDSAATTSNASVTVSSSVSSSQNSSDELKSMVQAEVKNILQADKEAKL